MCLSSFVELIAKLFATCFLPNFIYALLLSISQTNLTLCILMDGPIHIDTITLGLPIVYFKGSQVQFSKL